jgi:hypothetical protein
MLENWGCCKPKCASLGGALRALTTSGAFRSLGFMDHHDALATESGKVEWWRIKYQRVRMQEVTLIVISVVQRQTPLALHVEIPTALRCNL